MAEAADSKDRNNDEYNYPIDMTKKATPVELLDLLNTLSCATKHLFGRARVRSLQRLYDGSRHGIL